MTTNHHTPIATGAAANASTINGPLSQLDTKITSLDADITALESGWQAGPGTWSYSSADAPTFVISIDQDVTGLLSPGMRIKLTQTTVKYFLVTAVGAYSGGVTLVTVYGGTDYTLTNAAISSPAYAYHKAPFGFPLDPAKWTVTYSNSSSVSQASPVNATWYNPGSQLVSIPIGVWNIEMEYLMECVATVTGSFKATLSTANNSESNAAFSCSVTILTTGSNRMQINKPQKLALAAKTTYYLNIQAAQASQTSIGFLNAAVPTTLRAICAYL